MSRKRKTYNADFKAKLVLELLESDKTLNDIASKYEVLPKSLLDLHITLKPATKNAQHPATREEIFSIVSL